VRIGERANGDGDHVRERRHPEEDRRAALRAEGEDPFFAVVGDADVLGVPPFGSHLVCVEPRLNAERASRSALTGKAVTDRNANGIALRYEPKLLTATCGIPRRHPG